MSDEKLSEGLERDAARSEVLRMAEKLKITDPLLQSPAYSVGWNAALDMLIGDIGCLAPSVVSQPSRERTPHEEVIYQSGRLHGLTDAMTDPAMNKAREREVLEARLDEHMESCTLCDDSEETPFTCARKEELNEALSALTAAPASTGGTPR